MKNAYIYNDEIFGCLWELRRKYPDLIFSDATAHMAGITTVTVPDDFDPETMDYNMATGEVVVPPEVRRDDLAEAKKELHHRIHHWAREKLKHGFDFEIKNRLHHFRFGKQEQIDFLFGASVASGKVETAEGSYLQWFTADHEPINLTFKEFMRLYTEGAMEFRGECQAKEEAFLRQLATCTELGSIQRLDEEVKRYYGRQ